MAQPANDSVRRKKPAQTSQKRAAGTPVEPPEDATEAVMGLDMLLVDAARGPLRRMIPPAGTTLRFGTALARRPGTVARRAGELARELGRDHGRPFRTGSRARRTSASPTRPGRAIRCCTGRCRRTSPPPAPPGS